MLHAEFLLAVTRVQLKLASTIPPPRKSVNLPHKSSQWSFLARKGLIPLTMAHVLSLIHHTPSPPHPLIPSTSLPTPSPGPLEGTQKPSSLRSKVKERREKEEKWQRTLSGLTAANVSVETEAELRARCGRDRYSTALLLMLQASSSSSRLEPPAREALLEVGYRVIDTLISNCRVFPSLDNTYTHV